MSALSAFNKILVEFAKNLETTFPEDKDFLVFRRGIEDLLKYNSVAPIGMFKSYLEPTPHDDGTGKMVMVDLKKKLIESDVSFFVEEMDYTHKLEENDSNTSNAFDTIDKLKKYWSKLTPQGQTTVMKYLSSLVKISDQI